jgi:hypothetical protein
MRRNNTRNALLVGLAALLVGLAVIGLTRCGGDDKPDTPATSTSTTGPDDTDATSDATGEPSNEPSDQPSVETGEDGPLPDAGPEDDAPFYANTEPDTSEGSAGALLGVTDLRFGVHDGYDRLVIDLEGDGDPSWRAEYVDVPTGDASGLVVDLKGNAFIDLAVRGMMYPGEDGAPPYGGPNQILPTNSGVVREVRFDSVFEGVMHIFVGVESKEPFRVFLIKNPTRIVLAAPHP